MQGVRQRTAVCLLVLLLVVLPSCQRVTNGKASASTASSVSVGVTRVGRESLVKTLTLSSELVPFQEIDVYAKESGYVQKLLPAPATLRPGSCPHRDWPKSRRP
jgi:multidrug efflux pump subunit AcrA (membrane-fusion protein)